MNLLFDFLKNLNAAELERLSDLKARGLKQEVWLALNEQATKGEFDKDAILAQLKISAAHFDKITSELLANSYEHLCPGTGLTILDFLTTRLAYVKHFYSELNRQMKRAERELDKEQQKKFYRLCMDISFLNLPIVYRDEAVYKKMATKYLSLFDGKEKDHIKLLINCKLFLLQVDKLFAASKVKDNEKRFEKKLKSLGPLPADADEQLTFEYYWTQIYHYHAQEKFNEALAIVEAALVQLQKFKSEANDINTLRIQLKKAEFLYYSSMFDEAAVIFEEALNLEVANKIIDQGYYIVKYIQVSLIVGKLEGPWAILSKRRKMFGDRLEQALAPRDIFSFIKYYLFAGEYEEAFKFIQLGFERNPKGKYFQYEIELRNLQTAYFFLTGQYEQALDGCNKHLKYLRFHGYTLSNSAYPFFYVLTKAIFHKKTIGKELTKKEKEMLERYQKGSYGIYGKLLLKMLESNP